MTSRTGGGTPAGKAARAGPSGAPGPSRQLSSEAGTDANIYRLETSIETRILENLSLRFSLKIKHQTEVPVGRDETDTEAALTLVMNF